MSAPLHPFMVHFPMALSFLMPFLVLVFAVLIKKRKMDSKAWIIIIGLQLMTTVTGYIALETGEDEEHKVAKVVSKSLIHEHEEAAEIFVSSTVMALVLGIAVFFVKEELQFKIQLIITLLSFGSTFLAYRTGFMGGELVYVHGAARAYGESNTVIQENLLPTPGLNTSESDVGDAENESLKADENDYGDVDEVSEIEDESSKTED